jgi:hypothetical protein
LMLTFEGLKRLEYRGYDSAGFSITGSDGKTPQIYKVSAFLRLLKTFRQLETLRSYKKRETLLMSIKRKKSSPILEWLTLGKPISFFP